MKTLLIMLISVALSLGVLAQRKGHYHVYRPRVNISHFSYGLGYGSHYFGYPYYGNPYGYPYGYRRMPYRLELQIESIKEDYRHKIREARKDKSLGHAQRREEIRNLKAEREEDIINAKRNFSRRVPVTNDRNPETNNQDNYVSPNG